MRTHYPPLEPLTESDSDPRAAFAASLMEALKVPPVLAPGVAARIELQLTRAATPRMLDAPWLARLVPKLAPAFGVLVVVSGSAIAAYRTPAVALGFHRLVREVAGWADEMNRRSAPAREPGSAPGAEEPAEPPAAPGTVAGTSATPSAPAALVTNAASALAPRKTRRRPPSAPSPGVAASSGPAMTVAPSRFAESAELERAFTEKRRGRLEAADSIFSSYRSAHPSGSLATEAALGQLDVEIALGHLGDALGLLDLLCDDRSAPRWNELRLLRAELLSQTGRCAQALGAFSELLQSPAPSELAGLEERALYGRAICLQRLGQLDESRRAFRELLEHHPNGSLAAQARLALSLPR